MRKVRAKRAAEDVGCCQQRARGGRGTPPGRGRVRPLVASQIRRVCILVHPRPCDVVRSKAWSKIQTLPAVYVFTTCTRGGPFLHYGSQSCCRGLVAEVVSSVPSVAVTDTHFTCFK